jgi:CubicO group peptidase (beta-lactamase class C family)
MKNWSSSVFQEDLTAFVNGVTETCASVNGLSLSVVKDGESIFADGFGTRSSTDSSPVTSDTLFGIGSTTKAFTGALCAMVEDTGTFRLDDVLATTTSLAWNSRALDDVVNTIDLLAHRTGVPRNDFAAFLQGPNGIDRSRRVEYTENLHYLESSQSVRDSFLYNNWMYTAAGVVCANATQFESWESHLQESILDPLDMSSTFSTIDEAVEYGDFSTPEPYKFTDSRPIEVQGPAGVICSTSADMCKWMAMLLNHGLAPDDMCKWIGP